MHSGSKRIVSPPINLALAPLLEREDTKLNMLFTYLIEKMKRLHTYQTEHVDQLLNRKDGKATQYDTSIYPNA